MNTLHERALLLSRQHRRTEAELVSVLREIERLKLHRTLGFSSLFTYAVSALGLSESVAYALISVARKSREIGALNNAIAAQKISVSRASRIVAALTFANAAELIEFAASHTQRETDQKVAQLGDRPNGKRENLKVSAEVVELLKQAQTVVASRRKCSPKLDETLQLVLEDFLQRHDPMRKAERAKLREQRSVQKPDQEYYRKLAEKAAPSTQPKNSVCTKRKTRKNRKSVPARLRHIINTRDQARCTFIDLAGNRCSNDRWLHAHHVRPVSRGGGDEPENLTLLCSFHHDLVHQLGFEIGLFSVRSGTRSATTVVLVCGKEKDPIKSKTFLEF